MPKEQEVKEPQAKMEAPTQQAAPAAQQKKLEAIDSSRFSEASFKRAEYLVTAPAGMEPGDLLDPMVWAHVAAQLQPWCRIEARANDGTWFAELLVLEASRNWARVHILHAYNLTTSDVSQSLAAAGQLMPYEILHRGPHSQWSVIRKLDRSVMHEGEATQQGAINWLRDRMVAERR